MMTSENQMRQFSSKLRGTRGTGEPRPTNSFLFSFPRLPHNPRFAISGLSAFLASLLTAGLASAAHKPAAPLPPPPAVAPQAVLEQWQGAQYRFSPQVEAAFLEAAKTATLKQLAAAGKSLPEDFLAWVDSDPIVRTTVYGARQDTAGILLMLRSLELDLGQEVVRKKYTQLALAMAVVHAKDGDKANLSPRQPLVLQISGDPRKWVDTHAKDRPLDLDDHIINFLNDHAPLMEEVVVGYKEELPELVYDSTGQPVPQKPTKPKKEAIKEKRPRPLRAADVIADAALEQEFNDYLKTHGQSVQIHCGAETRLNWNSHDTKGIDGAGTKAAYELFVHAYKAKGYLPPEKDPVPTPAESCAFLIRNNESTISPEKKSTWPKFPLTAPWPVLTLLADDAQPLRERQDIWERYRDKGEFHGYGEYVGNIAQSPVFLEARRVAPYAFNYGSVQMMLKDGGVCGTMANIAVRSYKSLGVPASTAGQPGHCALVRFDQDGKTGTYRCIGGQYATAGDAGTGVHVPWFFGDVDARKPMVYHQSVAWSVNDGFQAYLDSTVAHTLFKQLPEADRKAHGTELLQSALRLCPYNFLLVDDALDNAVPPTELVAFWKQFKPTLASGKPGCPADGLYNQTIQDKLFARLAALPVPPAAEARSILAFLQEEKCSNQSTLAAYKLAIGGLPTLLAETENAFRAHLASSRNEAACSAMADRLNAAASKLPDKKQRAQWALTRWREIQGKEMYFKPAGRYGGQLAMATDASVGTLAKLAGQKPRPEKDQVQSLLDSTAQQFRVRVAAPRNPQDCKKCAETITKASALIKDPDQKRQWLETLSRAIAGKEQYQFQAKGKTQTLRDPCADSIQQLLGSAG
jgi:hypothetical protein